MDSIQVIPPLASFYIQKQELCDGYTETGYHGKVLIVSDRLKYVAEALACYLRKKTDICVIGITGQYAEAKTFMATNDISLVIFAGYLSNQVGYQIAKDIKTKWTGTHTVFWAMYDELIRDLCREHHIEYTFDRRKPMKEFVDFIAATSL